MMNRLQTRETAPIARVDTSGVRCLGWIRPKIRGIESKRAIDSVVRAVGRIVVWVEAEAEVRTAMIRILSSGDPSTSPQRALRTSSALCLRKTVPAYAWAETATTT